MEYELYMENDLFEEFVQTFLVERKDFLSNSGREVLTPGSLEEALQRFEKHPCGGDGTIPFSERLELYEEASKEAKIVFAHANWLYSMPSKGMTDKGKMKDLNIIYEDIPDCELRDDIFLDKEGIADHGAAYGTDKCYNVLFILMLFKWINGSQAEGGFASIRNAIINISLYACYEDISYLHSSFGPEKIRDIVEGFKEFRTQSGSIYKLGIYHFLLNLSDKDYYQRIVKVGEKILISKLFKPEYIEGENIRLEDMNIDDKLHYILKHFRTIYSDLDENSPLRDQRIKRLWEDPQKDPTSYWVFQGNPDIFDIVGALKEEAVNKWRVTSHVKNIKKGDKIILWVTGQQAGCYALGEISGDIEYNITDIEDKKFYKDDSYNTLHNRVAIKITHNLVEKPISWHQIKDMKEMEGLNVGIQGTNFRASKEEYMVFEKLATAQEPTNIGNRDMPSQKTVTPQKQYPLNQILYGPPGTGKTYNSINIAVEIADPEFMTEARTRPQVKDRYQELVTDGRIVFCTFHQSMGYEDFIEGIKPVTTDAQENNISYEVLPGIFKTLCEAAAKSVGGSFDNPDGEFSKASAGGDFVLIIDEINRGNISQIFGELITLIEKDKRAGKEEALEVTLPYSKEMFSVPSNLYIIGTMNTADRSVEALDTALRRRFTFKEFQPLYEIIGDDGTDLLARELCGYPLKEILKTLNNRIKVLLDRDHQIGHSYFLGLKKDEELMEVFNQNIIPLLQEYFYGDYARIGLVLGEGFVKKETLGENDISTFEYDDVESLVKENYQLVLFDKVDEFRAALETMMAN